MAWNVEHTDEFAEWYHGLSEAQQDDITAAGLLLIEQGPQLPFPFSSGINGSKHAHMRELRVQSGGRPLRVFFTLSIPGGRQFCLLAATRRAMIAFTSEWSRSPTNFMTSTSPRSGRKD
jgi:hypothetical protein